ncbi:MULTISPECIES: extracellular solute-binding protein [Actinoalloteichus]|uniref:Multiple sugar transport system substrate-binding protein n=1 Tax=Actinoalloteichus caeruleus DSM 43889 TaxID=1120930 RepID=A0ABT1JQH3_ACTCY|nr:extracellular solute-binding protein [Actinoalloteichus caeruleus]MCP2334622.1 multiple sugar transport system substrate-binding protein [Actinoalloteichus caeruleus DSM 43889]
MTPRDRSRRLSRRAVLGGALGLGSLGALGALGACAPPRFSDGTPLRFWHLFAGGDGINMNQMLDAYRAAHPEVDLEAVTLAWGERYYTKLSMSGAGGRAPDVSALHLARLPGYAPSGLIDPLRPDLLAEAGIREEDFPPELWRRSHHDGRLFAVPLDVHPYVLYYNVDVCERAGLLAPDGSLAPITGQDELRAAFAAAKEVTGHHGLVTETVGSDTVGPWRVFWTLYRQLDGHLLTPEGTGLAVDDDKVLRVLEYMRGLTDDGLAPREVDVNGAVSLFASGHAGFFIFGDWEVSTFLETGTPFSMTRIPQVFDNANAQADAHVFVLPHRSDRTDEDHRRIYEFVAFLLRQSITWARGGHVPVYRPVQEDPEYLDLRPQSNYRSVADDAQLDPEVWFAGSASVMWLELGAVISAVFSGRTSPEQGVLGIRRVMEDLLDRPNPID